mmetsp:Transcript_14751/g.23425  ORF Transcript_14751/g.23425 Transcript_14751/m.23425 type:complete len:88 (+) Transcript_14751:8-271(+)|eukprot:CAMPEP_0179438156 /NCGR_PEP_ID=MMETSP0799-20121207/21930_1 /TAXON_ID=46947 /ORGANISM="Geminigera cryophila, Strain CCMP2564" /LENGTH=87 /DNA_ID=CAMNT_0021219573 /DNA_START=6 /DNA_END=269 /DNA_ORIENTATION=+
MQAATDHKLDKQSAKEVQSFVENQIKLQQIQAVVGKITDMCWDKCVNSKPGKGLTDTEKNCIANCSERFLDTSMFVANRIQQKHNKN